MFKIFYILSFFFLVDAENNQTSFSRKLQPRIWGGISANRSHFPFQVLIGTVSSICGGTLISKNFVLTASHCVANFDSHGNWNTTTYIEVAFGFSELNSLAYDTYNYIMKFEGTDIIIIHPPFNSSTIFNDIALIKLPREATLNPYVQLAYLPFKNETRGFTVGQQLFSSGWGRLGDDANKKPTELQYIETQIVDGKECIHPTINWFNNDVNICINAANRSICIGDSGGPNVVFAPRPILIGITSRGTIPSSEGGDFNDTCEAGLPQALTRVSHYIDWIHNHTGIQPVN